MVAHVNLESAKRFLLEHARLIERLRYEFLVEDGSSERVVSALAPYQNADGGFGNALEPDLRGAESQPVPVWTAFGVLDECNDFDRPTVERACAFLSTITTAEGGVPFVLSSVAPHAPWWTTDVSPLASLNPTAGLVGYLNKHLVKNSWLEPAEAFCWAAIDELRETSAYELGNILWFLETAPERDRADAAFTRLAEIVHQQGFIALDPDAEGEVHYPLTFAPSPTSLGRRLFSDDVIETHVDALARQQQPDGGWTVNWMIWTPITEHEWRGVRTVEVLRTLKNYGRLP
ncbi:MAG TPA: hypothetical protein VGP11_07605 [Acidimicrobiales bacterium]|nr:hypothetical protein [Acidimicrobiales bacterium]